MCAQQWPSLLAWQFCGCPYESLPISKHPHPPQAHLSEHLWQLLQELPGRLVLAKQSGQGVLDVPDDQQVNAERTHTLDKLIHLQPQEKKQTQLGY